MTENLKACYKCNITDHVELTKYNRIVKYKGKIVEYIHEGHYCKKCNREYDHNPIQTEANHERLYKTWLKLCKEN